MPSYDLNPYGQQQRTPEEMAAGYGGDYNVPMPPPPAGGGAPLPPMPAGAPAPGYGGGGAYGGAPQQVAWDPNPDTGLETRYDENGNPYQYSPSDQGGLDEAGNPMVAAKLGTSWEATREGLEYTERERGKNGRTADAWYPNMADFMYGRNPNQANADIARAQGMGQNAANTAATWGTAGANYALGQANGIRDQANSALDAGLGAAGNVAAAGQNVEAAADVNAQRQRQIGNAAANTGAGLGQDLTQAGAGYGRGVAQAGVAAQNTISTDANALRDVGQRYGAEVAQAGRSVSAVGQQRANTLAGLEATEGPSGAQGLLNQQNNRAMATQLALARSGRGMAGNAAATAMAAQNIGALQQDAGNQAAQLRAQENAAWRARQGQNLTAAGQMDIGARATGANLIGQGGGLESQGYGASGALRQTAAGQNIQAQTQAGALGMQGATAGAATTMQGLGLQGDMYNAGANTQMAGASANLAAAGTAAGVTQNAYGQALAGYGQAANTGLAGYQYGSDATMAGIQAQQQYEDYAKSIRGMEMEGGLALEDKYIRDYAVNKNAQNAEATARMNRDASYINKAVDSGVAIASSI